MKLTFSNGTFVLQLSKGATTSDNLAAEAELRRPYDIVGHCFYLNYSEASRFRKFADSKAEKVLKNSKLLLKAMPLPSGSPVCPPHLSLMEFQKEKGVPFILGRNKSYLAHQPGLGKSAQAICAVNTKPGKTLIIVPSFLRITWAREITKWSANDFPSIAIVPGTPYKDQMNWDADFIICSDAMILKDWVREQILRRVFKYIFIDEAHRFKSSDAARSVAIFGGKLGKLQSPGLIYNSEHVCALSGTPMLNRPIELWSILYAMAPETIDFMSYETFGFRFGGAWRDDRGCWHFTGSSREEELNKRIMAPKIKLKDGPPGFMQRIKKEDVLTDLPDKIREVIVVDQDPRAPEVKNLDRELLRTIKLDNLEPFEELGDYARIRHEIGLAKVDWVASYVYSLLFENPDESIILFAHHRDVVERLARSFLQTFPAMVINGGVPIHERTKIEDAFQLGKRRLIVGNIDAMNLGLTLTRASRVIFAEYAWTPALNEQAEDRAHRIGQKDSVFVQYIVLPNSMDEVILTALLKKEDSIRKVIG